MTDDHVESVLVVHDCAKTHDAQMNIVEGISEHLRALPRLAANRPVRHHLIMQRNMNKFEEKVIAWIENYWHTWNQVNHGNLSVSVNCHFAYCKTLNRYTQLHKVF